MGKPELTSIRFGEFEVDLNSWLLFRNNARVALQRKPFQILRLLLTRPGELITRAELAHELWPDLHVSYDHCLNTAMNALRTALGDPTRESRWIETHPGLGYRFAGRICVSLEPHANTVADDANEPDLAMGYYFLHRHSFESLTRARACFNAVVSHAGANVSGHLALAELENVTAICGFAPTRDASRRALHHARTAQQNNPTLPGTQIVLAVASALNTGDHYEAMHACETAPREPKAESMPARLWLGELLCCCGQAGEAVKHLQRAKRENPASLLIRSKLSLALYLAGDSEAAAEQAWAALSMEPACAGAQYALALAYQQLGQLDDAVTEFENAANCPGTSAAALAGLCHALSASGQTGEARNIAARLRESAQSTYVSHCWHALVQLATGDRASAELSLRRAFEAGDYLLGFLSHDPRLQQSEFAAEQIKLSSR